jgi:hypothetical protein
MAFGWILGAVAALAAEAPEDEAPLPPRHTNPGFGLGIASLGVGDPVGHRYGLLLDLRKEEALAPRLQFNAVLSAGVTRPQNTAVVAQWGLRAGGTVTRGFGSVSDWVAAGRGTDTHGLRTTGAMVAYFGLGVSYVVVPVALVVSPLASVGHVVGGATVSWHTDSASPNAYVEGGFGGLLFGHPVSGAPAVGCGPLVGAGTQLGRQTVGVRLLVSPPGLNVAGDGRTDTVWSGAVALGL